jgi:hypothetical protein
MVTDPHSLTERLEERAEYHGNPIMTPFNRKTSELLAEAAACIRELEEALGEIEWSNNSKWQQDRARAARRKT